MATGARSALDEVVERVSQGIVAKVVQARGTVKDNDQGVGFLARAEGGHTVENPLRLSSRRHGLTERVTSHQSGYSACPQDQVTRDAIDPIARTAHFAIRRRCQTTGPAVFSQAKEC